MFKKLKAPEKVLLAIAVCALVAIIIVGGFMIRSCGPSVTTPTGGGTLHLFGADPNTLDPAASADTDSFLIINQVYSGLVKLDDNLEPAPDIAEGWDTSEDGRTFTFHLRDNVTFQDGRKVTAADFKYSWERACDPATGSTVAKTYLGDIVGANDVLAGKTKEISGVKVIDDRTLQVTIDAPKSYFLFQLTYATAMVVDKNNVAKGADWWRTPNGTGAFKLKEWQPSSKLVLERYDNYYGQVATLDYVEVQMYTGDEMSLYETGKIDVSGVYTTTIDRVTDKEGPFVNEYHTSPLLNFSYLGFNTNKPPFDDVNVRQAFTMAIDKDKIIKLTLRNLDTNAKGILPPGIPGYNQNLKGLDFNIEAAKALITASKYGSVANLPPITITTGGYGGDISQTLEAMITMWRENLGVEVKVRQLEPDYYLYHLKDEVDNIYDMGWTADYPHPQDFLDVLFGTGADYNYGGYSNTQFDKLLAQAGVEQDLNKSLALYQQAEQMLVNDAAIIPLWFGDSHILVKPYVQGYQYNVMGNVLFNKVKILPH